MVWYIVGGSPTIEQLMIGLITANLIFLIKIYGNFQKHLGEHEAYKKSEQNQ